MDQTAAFDRNSPCADAPGDWLSWVLRMMVDGGGAAEGAAGRDTSGDVGAHPAATNLTFGSVSLAAPPACGRGGQRAFSSFPQAERLDWLDSAPLPFTGGAVRLGEPSGEPSRSGVGQRDLTNTDQRDPAETDQPSHPTILTPERQAAFLEHLAQNGNVRLACRVAGASPQTLYRARRGSRGFARAWDAALLAARHHAEDVLADRALNGVDEPVFYHGEEVARRRRYSDRLLLSHLARLDRKAEQVDAELGEQELDAAIALLRGGEELADEALTPSLSDSERGQGANCEEVAGAAGGARVLRERSCGEGAPAQDERGLALGGPAKKDPLDCVPCVPSAAEPPVAACPECGGRCAQPDAELGPEDCQWFGNRLERMYAALPEDAAPGPWTEREATEWRRILAFEEGRANWWVLDDDDPLAAFAGECAEPEPAGNALAEEGAEAGGDTQEGARATGAAAAVVAPAG